jgi:2-C-methyl-D-erythritol 4-phosphate cytidylyltransferase
MASELPKQFIEIHNRPIILRTIDAFVSVYPDIELIVVLAKDQFKLWEDICLNHNFKHPRKLIEGGEERFQSIQNGLTVCSGDLILVHDAVRPLVSSEVILNCVQTAEVTGAAIPVLPVKFSLRQITFDESVAVNRSEFREVQTPQVFKVNVLKLAYEQAYDSKFTDDASVVENCGHDIALVDGNEENIKITTQFDFKIAELFLA